MTPGVAVRVAVAMSLAAITLASCSTLTARVPEPDRLEQWSRTPLPPDPAMTQLAIAGGGCGREGGPPPLLLQDRRTPSTAMFLAIGPTSFGNCQVSAGESGGGGWSSVVPSLAGTIGVHEENGGDVGGSAASRIGGLLAPDVAEVQVDLESGLIMRASLGHGLWLAWWPGLEKASRVAAMDGTGAIIEVLERVNGTWSQQGAPS